MGIRIINGDCLAEIPKLPDDSIDSCVTDPPYHLTTGKKGGSGQASVNLDSPHGRARDGTGFMAMEWDGGDLAHRSELWAQVLRVLKPGAYLLAFGGTRTYHRLACAIEDAGFEIRDQIGWAFGSGFPKSHNGTWGGTALKPAWEPIAMARKPFRGTVAANVAKYGTGALNIDGCRIPVNTEVDDPRLGGKGDWSSDKMAKNVYEGGYAGDRVGSSPLGRWPANLIHDGSDEVLEAFPDAPGQIADASSKQQQQKNKNVYGNMKRGNGRGGEPSADSKNDGVVGFNMRPGARRMDIGSAARFFYCAKADRDDRNEGLHKNRQAQNHHPTVKPTDLMRYLCRLVTPKGGTVLDPFLGSGSTLKAAELEGFSAIGIEINPEYCDIARQRIAGDAPLFSQEFKVD